VAMAVRTSTGRSRAQGSLRRLQTDYIDLYWLHHWDLVTPVEEVLGTLGDLARAGRIRYFGFSNVPSWCAAQAATLAQVRGVPNPIALQLEYSLVESGIEREYVGAARQFGLGITSWSPLGCGVSGREVPAPREKSQRRGTTERL